MWPHILCGRRPLCHRFMLSLAVVGSTHTMHAATIDVIGSAYSHPLWPHILCGRRPLCHRFMLSLSVIGSTQTTHAETISFLFAVRGCSSIQMLCATPVTRRLLRTSAVCASRVVDQLPEATQTRILSQHVSPRHKPLHVRLGCLLSAVSMSAATSRLLHVRLGRLLSAVSMSAAGDDIIFGFPII